MSHSKQFFLGDLNLPSFSNARKHCIPHAKYQFNTEYTTKHSVLGYDVGRNSKAKSWLSFNLSKVCPFCAVLFLKNYYALPRIRYH